MLTCCGGHTVQNRPITANPSQIMIEQLAALGVKYVFYNSGSREAQFFDALQAHPDIDGILALHEGSVTAMAGGFTQVKLDPAVMVVHLGAGLAQCLGQLINVWAGSLPVVVITFAGDTGSFADQIGLDLSHNFGPTSPGCGWEWRGPITRRYRFPMRIWLPLNYTGSFISMKVRLTSLYLSPGINTVRSLVCSIPCPGFPNSIPARNTPFWRRRSGGGVRV